MKKLNLSLLSLLILTCSVFTFQNSLAGDDKGESNEPEYSEPCTVFDESTCTSYDTTCS